MINVPILRSSQINRQIDEIQHRRVPLTYRRFSPAFKQPDVTALLQSILLAQVGETSGIPSIISSTTNSAFSQSVNQLKPNPTILNHNSLTRAVPTADTPTIIPSGVTITGQPTLIPTSVKTPTLTPNPQERTPSAGGRSTAAKGLVSIAKETDAAQNLIAMSIPESIKQRNEFNVKDRLNISHIRQQTNHPVHIEVTKRENMILATQAKSRDMEDQIQTLKDQLNKGSYIGQHHKNQVKSNLLNAEGRLENLKIQEQKLITDVKELNSNKDVSGVNAAIEKQPRKRGSGASKKKKPSSKV
tara:strand:- start:1642 stop:2544 length:903 start_codon:yes stop_codon:yes gene_type:complete